MNRKKLTIIFIIMLICMLFAGCSKTIEADLSAYENESITIEGIGDKTITVTIADLKEMDCTGKSVTTKSKGREITVEAAGPTLETLLSECGVSLSAVSEVTVIARDGYTKQFDSGFFATHPDVYLSIANGDEPLNDDEQPLRFVIPGTTADNWIKAVKEIRFK